MHRMLNRLMPVVLAQRGANPLLAGVICPAITPALGAEMVTNGNMETGTPPSNWVGSGADLTAGEERTGGAGAQGLTITNSAAGWGVGKQTGRATTAGMWIQISAWAKNGSHSGVMKLFDNGASQVAGSLTMNSATWAQFIGIWRATTINSQVGATIGNNAIGNNINIDDVSMLPITFTSTRAYIGVLGQKNGTYQCTPTGASGSIFGMLVEYADDNNFVMVIVDRVANQAKLVSRIAGTYAEARAGNITYGAAKVLKVIVSGTTHTLYYDGSAVGASVVIDNSGMGTAVYGFNTLAGNSIGTVTANPT